MSVEDKLDIKSPEFWNEEGLLKEELRQFDVCHGCRLCWNLCPSFPALFEETEALEEGRKTHLTRDDLRVVEDQCYQCKLCFVRCPYTPPHEWALDIPRLLTRAKLVNKRKEGVRWQDRLLADTDRVGAIGRVIAPLINTGNSAVPVRFVLEKALGVDRRAKLPSFHTRTFDAWFKRNEAELVEGLEPDAKTVALFTTCTVNYNDPAVAIAATRVLAHNGVRPILPSQQCCGMPFLDAGDLSHTLEKIKANSSVLAEQIRRGHDIVVLSPSCSLMMKQEYPVLVENEDTKLIAEHTYDISEFLWNLNANGSLKRDFGNEGFRRKVNKIAYHAPCHIRAQFMGNCGANLMDLIDEKIQVAQVERCSAHDGTWGVKRESYELSQRYAKKLYVAMIEEEADLFATDCPLAAQQIHHGTGIKPLHPVQVLLEAYGL